MAGAKLISAVVAPGRTVFSDAQSSKGWDPDGKREVDIVKASKPKGPGETVSLPEDEVIRLRGLGFLLKSDATPVDNKSGPSLTVNEGPQIREV